MRHDDTVEVTTDPPRDDAPFAAAAGFSRRRLLATSGLTAAGGLVAWGAGPSAAASASPVPGGGRTQTRFELTVAPAAGVRAGPGRVFVLLAKPSDLPDGAEPREALADDAPLSAPFFGMDVPRMRPDRSMLLQQGESVVGFPVEISDLPAGDYVVQGFFCTYETNHRSDGSVVQVHWPSGDGGNIWASPGNIYSTPRRVTIGRSAAKVRLTLDQVIGPVEPIPPGGVGQQGNRVDSEHVKHFKIRSTLLSRFWGRDVYLGADVLLPHGYDAHPTQSYPMELAVGHFPRRNPHSFSEALDNDFSQWWVSDQAARFISVQVRNENPFYDDSYNVNSANLGPYGDAINRELMAEVDARFRTIGQRWARTVWGGSTGGWIAAASLLLYPDVFGGAWAGYPDSLDFRAHQVINVYDDANAYYHQGTWHQVPRPSARAESGDTIWTNGQENHFERAVGSRARSQGQWDVWAAVFGPQGHDGYPADIWDKATGQIDHTVAEGWRAFDLSEQTTRRWSTIGEDVAGRLCVYVGTEDTYFLHDGVRFFEQTVASLPSPAPDFQFIYGTAQRHGWSPVSTPEMITTMADFVAKHAPAGTDVSGWRGSEDPPAVMLTRGRQVLDAWN
jgi:hypothetical protein